MKLLHTSDWHLGRQFHGLPLDDDHDNVLGQIYALIEEHEPEVLIIAGDIFDRANPPQSALKRLSDFLKVVRDRSNTAIVLIAGNHDSAAQIGALGVLAEDGRVLVRGPLDKDERPLIINDQHGPVAISALPFAFEYAASQCFDDDTIACPADVIRAQLASARRHLTDDMRWVVVAHAFVDGAATSESERPLAKTVGGIDTVSADAFSGAHYVALGHLHRPQSVGGEHIRYSGAPLAFGFDEEGQPKSVTMVNLSGDGTVQTEIVPIEPLRQVRAIRGKIQELLATTDVSTDFVRVILTDTTPQIDPMKRIREFYPNAVQLTYERDERPIEVKMAERQSAIDDPRSLAADFIAFVRGDAMSEAEGAIVDQTLLDLQTGGDNQ